MDYDTALRYIDSFIDFEKIQGYNYASSFNLDRIHAFLHDLGDPHSDLKTIHVAGSKGKGSTCAIIAALLRQAGYSVGVYTSPHLLDERERVRILDNTSRKMPHVNRGFEGVIEKEELVALIEKIEPVAERFRDHKELGRLSFFEIFTACAFIYFKERKVDFSVLETGLGGRLDATNVTDPVVCGITNISLEHTDKLGDSLEAIAREKSGIIKRGVVAVSATQEKVVTSVIQEVCRERGARLLEIGRDIKYTVLESDEGGQVFNLDALGCSYKDLKINLIGAHQVENAALAITMAKTCIEIDKESLSSGLREISWPGRLHVIQRRPYIILDGAQNVASIKAALSSIKKVFPYKKLICIFGILNDKDIRGVAGELDRSIDTVILTRSCSGRAADPFSLKGYFSKTKAEVTSDLGHALRLGKKILDEGDLLLITGSLYIVGEAMKYFKLNL